MVSSLRSAERRAGRGLRPSPSHVCAQESESNQSKVRVTAFFQNL